MKNLTIMLFVYLIFFDIIPLNVNAKISLSEQVFNRYIKDFQIEDNMVIQNQFQISDFYNKDKQLLQTKQNNILNISNLFYLYLPISQNIIYVFDGSFHNSKSNYFYNYSTSNIIFIYTTNTKNILLYNIKSRLVIPLSRKNFLELVYGYSSYFLKHNYVENNFNFFYSTEEKQITHYIRLRYRKDNFAGFIDGNQRTIRDTYTTILKSTNRIVIDSAGLGVQYFKKFEKSVFFIESYVQFSFLPNSVIFNVYNANFSLNIPEIAAYIKFSFIQNYSIFAYQINNLLHFDIFQSYNNKDNIWEKQQKYQDNIEFIPYFNLNYFTFYVSNRLLIEYSGPGSNFIYYFIPGLIWEKDKIKIEAIFNPDLVYNYSKKNQLVNISKITVILQYHI